MTNQLKSEFSIETNDDNAVVILLALKGLGYTVWSAYDVDHTFKMEGWNYVCRVSTCSGNVSRTDHKTENHFTTFNDFLKWHNTPEKSEAEIELDKLNDKMKELQAQINRVSETVNKENSK